MDWHKTDKPFIIRLMKDIREFYNEKSKDMFIVAEDSDISVVHALIMGPENTPYQNGFFYFVLRYPKEYPMNPPDVKLITTGGQRVRFSPNLYACGKVCLSILGTWGDPTWSAAQTIFTTLLSIQTLMSENPYHNEPGFEPKPKPKNEDIKLFGVTIIKDKAEEIFDKMQEPVKKAVKDYNELITHETIRVAVLQMLDDNTIDAKNMPSVLKNIMISEFKSKYQSYEDLIRSKIELEGQPIIDPFRDPERPKTFQYKQLLDRLLKLKERYLKINKDSDRANCVDTNTSSLKGDVPYKSENECSLQESADPLVEYNKIAAKMLPQKFSKPIQRSEQTADNCDDLIDSMNEDINDGTVDDNDSQETVIYYYEN